MTTWVKEERSSKESWSLDFQSDTFCSSVLHHQSASLYNIFKETEGKLWQKEITGVYGSVRSALVGKPLPSLRGSQAGALKGELGSHPQHLLTWPFTVGLPALRPGRRPQQLCLLTMASLGTWLGLECKDSLATCLLPRQ